MRYFQHLPIINKLVRAFTAIDLITAVTFFYCFILIIHYIDSSALLAVDITYVSNIYEYFVLCKRYAIRYTISCCYLFYSSHYLYLTFSTFVCCSGRNYFVFIKLWCNVILGVASATITYLFCYCNLCYITFDVMFVIFEKIKFCLFITLKKLRSSLRQTLCYSGNILTYGNLKN